MEQSCPVQDKYKYLAGIKSEIAYKNDSVRWPMCDEDLETEDHIFVLCNIAIWDLETNLKMMVHHQYFSQQPPWCYTPSEPDSFVVKRLPW